MIFEGLKVHKNYLCTNTIEGVTGNHFGQNRIKS